MWVLPEEGWGVPLLNLLMVEINPFTTADGEPLKTMWFCLFWLSESSGILSKEMSCQVRAKKGANNTLKGTNVVFFRLCLQEVRSHPGGWEEDTSPPLLPLF
jgi:hypothetical protein